MVLVVVLEVDRELVHSQILQLTHPLHVRIDGTDDAEAVDDLVGHELRVNVPRLTVLVVVVALSTFDVVGERRRHRTAVAVARHDVGDVVADHATEPTTLVAAVGEPCGGAVGDVRRRSDADRDLVGVAAGRSGRRPHGADGPFGDRQIGQLEDETVADLTGERQCLGSVGGDPHLEPALAGPREADLRTVVVHAAPVAELADDVDAVAQRGQRGG